ncbi:MAG: LysR family transcriptional regulator [Nitrospirota bacterium]|nr:LysR family transcriptional regulator [Nitrospirota bacterium]
MEWQQIIGFYQLVKQKSFTGAANASFRTQSALSQQIRKLEDEFQCQLVNRISRKKFTLSPAGERFYQFASSVINDYSKLSDDIAAIKGLSIGKLKIAAPFTTLYHLFPEQLKAYLKDYPHVEITILDRTQSQAIELLKNGDIDIAVALESFVPKGFDVRRWKDIYSVLIVPDRHPLLNIKQVTLQDIAKYPLILPPMSMDNKSRSRIDHSFEEEGIEYRVIMESSNVELSSRYVEAGIGISFATIAAGVNPLTGRHIKFIPMSRYFESDYISVVCKREKGLPSYMENFMSQILGK